MTRIRTLRDVVEWRMCVGCGACVQACTHGAVRLRNLVAEGIRPEIDSKLCAECPSCAEVLAVCPGHALDADHRLGKQPRRQALDHEIGPVFGVWEGYAADPEIRLKGSSGAVLTALALYCLEREGMEFALHTAACAETPWLNETVCSRTRAQLLERAGSRYAPASPCDGLDAIEQSPRPCVFIGKPCDAAAAVALARRRPALREKLVLNLAFFCAGAPSTQGTLNLLSTLEVNRDEVQTLRYRGEGWPGDFKVTRKTGPVQRLGYQDTWGRLTHYRAHRCQLCPDGLGQLADIACGDAWHRYAADGDPGRSIVLVRTAKAEALLRRAVSAGYVELTPLDPAAVLAAQPGLVERRRQVYGRVLGMRLLGVPAPRFQGFGLGKLWLRQGPAAMLKTVLGTVRRVLTRGLWRRKKA